MIAPFAIALALVAGPTATPAAAGIDAAPAAVVGEAAQATGRFELRPETVAVGEPFQLVLDVTHGAERVVTSADELELDPSWVLFEAEREPAVSVGGERRRTRFRWTVASLEPGRRPVADGFRAPFEALGIELPDAAPAIEVVGVLAEGEDAPRPLRGFPDWFRAGAGTADERATWPFWLGGLAALLTGAGVAMAMWSRRARSRPSTELAPLDELDRLRGSASRGPAAVRESHFGLARLVRRAIDRSLARGSRDGMTDEEWLAGLAGEPRLEPEARDELARVLERCTAARWAGDRPTDWALEETFAAARRAIERVTAGGTPAAEGAR